jgi:sulfur relay (sulfurtransferase) complex TusBCD TusD component (DsrE family)
VWVSRRATQRIPDAASAPGAHTLAVKTFVVALNNHAAEIGLCRTCMHARGIREDPLVEGTHRSGLDQLTEWTLWATR